MALLATLTVLLAGSGAFGPPAALAARTEADPQAELEEVRRKIQAVSRRASQTRKAQDEHSEQLEALETGRAHTLETLATLRSQLDSALARVAEARAHRERLQERAEAFRTTIAAVVRATHGVARHDVLRLLLSQDHPRGVTRMLRTAGRIQAAQAERLEAVRQAMTDLARATEAEEREIAELADLQRGQTEMLAHLESQRVERQAVLARLKRELGKDGALLKRLREDELRLGKLVKDLERELANIAAIKPNYAPFGKLRGRLAWPSRGKLLRRFGASIADGETESRGVVIGASPGARVNAVSHGRVAYAEWLRGYGLLLIIDHGDGYMSLYGHNQTLRKEVGEWVDAGDHIADVGDSGGQSRSGLYFEIRRKGRPLNPSRWCRGSPATKTAARAAAGSG